MILVTGGAGLIGSHVVDELRARGEAVRVIDSLSAPTHDGPPDWLRSDVQYVFADIRDRDALATALEGVDTLIHLAAHGGFTPGVAEYFDVNVTGYATILEVAAGRLRRAVVASSQGVYGHPDVLPVAEDVVSPRTPYAVSKLCLEQVALRLGAELGIATTALRFALTYGPRQSDTNPYCGIVSLFSQRLRRGLPVLVYEDGRQTRDFTYVTDVARAVVGAIDDPRTYGEVYNVGTGKGTPVVEVLAILGELWGIEPDVWLPGWRRPGDVRHLVTDASRLRALGWRSQVSLRFGLLGYIAWAKDRPLSPDPFDDGLERMRAAGVVVES